MGSIKLQNITKRFGEVEVVKERWAGSGGAVSVRAFEGRPSPIVGQGLHGRDEAGLGFAFPFARRLVAVGDVGFKPTRQPFAGGEREFPLGGGIVFALTGLRAKP